MEDSTISQAASIALGTAAVKAKALADAEEKRIKGLVSEVVQAQLRRLEIKLKQFDELETLLEQEHQKVRPGVIAVRAGQEVYYRCGLYTKRKVFFGGWRFLVANSPVS